MVYWFQHTRMSVFGTHALFIYLKPRAWLRYEPYQRIDQAIEKQAVSRIPAPDLLPFTSSSKPKFQVSFLCHTHTICIFIPQAVWNILFRRPIVVQAGLSGYGGGFILQTYIYIHCGYNSSYFSTALLAIHESLFLLRPACAGLNRLSRPCRYLYL